LPRRYGKLILLGDSPFPSRQHLIHDVHGKQLTIIGTKNEQLPPVMAYWTRERQILLFLEFVRRGQMHVADLVTERIRPREAPALYARLQERRDDTLGILIDWI
jgi:threonine dehydrogenase-like Zn-dependent dehydrogenase